jgi:TonB family protein
MNWIYYLLEANFYLAIFYLLYYFAFRSETYYQLNRAYLLVSSVLAFIIPIVQLGFLKPVQNDAQVIAPITAGQAIRPIMVKTEVIPNSNIWHLNDYCLIVYLLIVSILLINLSYKIYKLVRLSKTNTNTTIDTYKLVETAGEQDAFSFFNYLFINPRLSFKNTVIRHELIHLRQRHSWDILFFEFLKIINWFNPVVYTLQYSIKELHEFIADSETIKLEQNLSQYTDFLVKNAYGISSNNLANTFFNKSLLKQRIIMLHQKRSGNLARLKILLALPVFGMLLCASTVGISKTYGWVDLAPGQEITNKSQSPVLIKADTLKRKLSVTSKGYKYEETGYLIENKANFRVIITEKNGSQKEYFKNSATTAELALLRQKYGYTFPAMEIYPKLPPPPPGPGKITLIDKRLPPPPLAPGNITSIDKRLPPPPPAPPARPKKLRRPPPPVVKADTTASIKKANGGKVIEGARNFNIQLAKTIKYPKGARENNYAGRVIALFTVSSENKVENISIAHGAAKSLDEETVETLQNCDAFNLKPGIYALPIAFTLMDKDGKYVGGNEGLLTYTNNFKPNKHVIGASKMLDEIVVTGYK